MINKQDSKQAQEIKDKKREEMWGGGRKTKGRENKRGDTRGKWREGIM